MIHKKQKLRSACVYLIFILSFSFLYYRLFILQIVHHEELLNRGLSLHRLNQKIAPSRGNIYDCRERPLAMSVCVKSAFAVPEDIESPVEAADLLARHIPLSRNEILKRLRKKKQFVWLARKLESETVDCMKALRIDGVRYREEVKRVYPQGESLSHVLGFVDIDNRGLEGLELVADRYLRGQSGWRASQRDRKGREILTLRNQDIPPIDGCHLALTVDVVVQHIAENELDKACRKHNAIAGSIIVMVPETGAILAMANWPKFDPNQPADFPVDWRRNRCITDIYEPGSTFKVVTVAAALDKGSVGMDDSFFCENGAFRVCGHTLHDVHAYENLTTAQIIQKSSNIGAVKIAMKLGEKPLYNAITRFGYGASTGLGLPGEVGGILRPVRSWSRLSIAAIPMGHEIGVTPLQMASAVAAIANSGLAMKPYIISEIRDSSGKVMELRSPQVRVRAVSDSTAQAMVSAMESVVSRDGTARRAELDEFTAAGKTGTSQKIDENGRYSHSRFIGSFVGFAPSRDPAVLVMVLLDEPHPYYYGGTVAAPVFREVATKVLKYLGVPPDKGEKGIAVAMKQQ